MNRKQIPVILPLSAGAISMIFSIIQGDSMIRRLTMLLITLVVFYLLGRFFQWILDTFDAQNEKQKAIEGEIVEKDGDGKQTGNASESDSKKETTD